MHISALLHALADTRPNEVASTSLACKWVQPGVGGIDRYSTSVFLEKILQYNYIPTIGVADLQAPLNNMLQTS